jgi:glycosyltransferase involved in cell wall biosynthesis
MKLLWHSVSPLCPTGYGNQTALFAPRLNQIEEYDVAVSSGYGLAGTPVDYRGVRVYPGFDWNQQVLTWRDYHANNEPCLTVTLMDVWPLDHTVFRHVNDTGGLACWVPVDHKPVTPGVEMFLRATQARPIAMSRFGEEQLRVKGFDPLYVPHGVDTELFEPFEDRAAARRYFGLSEDAFIVGMVANNEGVAPPRKAFPQALMAFKDFYDQHPEALLYLHCEMTGNTGMRQGVDLRMLASQFEIPDTAIVATNPSRMVTGVPQSELAALYSSMDVLLNPAYGEGFGVPIIEAQACGTPVIVSDWTAMPELCGAGWKVGGQPWYDCQHYSWFLNPSVDGIVAALEQLHGMPADKVEELRANARSFALQYDAGTITEQHWKPTLEALTRPREVQPLNRAMRRAAAKIAA